MLSEQNNIIHPGNYEEFFILYMDKELNHEQMKMVDEFLLTHPHLQPEFEMLMNTRLPAEEFNFAKEELLAEKMKLTSINEELLLYLDKELPLDKMHIVEQELACDKDYQLQYRALLQTKSDPAEQVVYPNKKELYRHTKKIAAFKPWMRAAAAIVIIAMAGLVYFKNTSLKRNTPTFASNVNNANTHQPSNTKAATDVVIPKEEATVNVVASKKNHSSASIQKKNEKNSVLQKNNNEVALNATHTEEIILPVKRVAAVDLNGSKIPATNNPRILIHNHDVTFSTLERTTISTAADDNNNSTSFAGNRTGSIRGFLRKATRMIEKRTGIDPANDNEELLIGAVAVSLK